MAHRTNFGYYNKTPNKSPRTNKTLKKEFCVLHETAGFGSLDWLLRPDVRASYTDIITRDGTRWAYINADTYYAWHAGIRSKWTVAGRTYTGGEINQASYGLSVEGWNDGSWVTDAQFITLCDYAAQLALHHGWQPTVERFPTHAQVAPGYKTDPLGYHQANFLAEVTKLMAAAIGGRKITYWTPIVDANIRSAPSSTAKIAGVLPAGQSFGADASWVAGEQIGTGDKARWWYHLEDGRGFVHSSIIVPKIALPLPSPYSEPLPVQAAPRISPTAFRGILAAVQSPWVGEADAIYRAFNEFKIDPAVALAFCGDTDYGKHEWARAAKTWAGVPTAFNTAKQDGEVTKDGQPIARYRNIVDSAYDWAERIQRRYIDVIDPNNKAIVSARTTIDRVLQRYNPYLDLRVALWTYHQRITRFVTFELTGQWQGGAA